jgi:tungstate transport system substrate-binding protein
MVNVEQQRPLRFLQKIFDFFGSIPFYCLLLIPFALLAAGCQTRNLLPGDGNIGSSSDGRVIILATTTSTQDSGLLDELVPIFEDQTGFVIKVIAVGTGQALKMGEGGNADVMLVHAPDSEKVLIENGSATDRRLVMHNDFIIVGPPADPAGVRGSSDPAASLAKIRGSELPFVSRGDDSGTHKRELAIWAESGTSMSGKAYLETGQGMAATLRIASEKSAYTLTDRATFLAQSNTLDLDIMVEGHESLLNLYHVMLVNSDRWPLVNGTGAQAWSDFLASDETQEMIGRFGLESYGAPLFYPDAGKNEGDLVAE